MVNAIDTSVVSIVDFSVCADLVDFKDIRVSSSLLFQATFGALAVGMHRQS